MGLARLGVILLHLILTAALCLFFLFFVRLKFMRQQDVDQFNCEHIIFKIFQTAHQCDLSGHLPGHARVREAVRDQLDGHNLAA